MIFYPVEAKLQKMHYKFFRFQLRNKYRKLEYRK